MSPSLRRISGSLLRGEKWQMQLLTETQVGKATPFFISFFPLKILLVSSVSSLSPSSHRSRTLLPGVHFSTRVLRTPATWNKRTGWREQMKKQLEIEMNEKMKRLKHTCSFAHHEYDQSLTVHKISTGFVQCNDNVFSTGPFLVLSCRGHGEDSWKFG